MGYYSDVVITIYEDDFKKMYLAARDEGFFEDFNDILSWCNIKRYNTDIISLNWQDIKWYDTFPEIGYIMGYIYNNCQYVYRRFGENNDDYEESYNDDDWLLCEASDIYRSFDVYGDSVVLDNIIPSAQQSADKDFSEISITDFEDILVCG